jgi:hypothetical protein
MADTGHQPGDGAQDGQDPTGDAGGTPPGAAGAEQSAADKGQEPRFERLERVDENTLRQLRQEAAGHRREASQLREQLTDRERTAKEIEAERDGLRAKLRDYQVREALGTALAGADVLRPDLVMKLLLADGPPVDAATGEVDGKALQDALEGLKRTAPELFRRNPLGGDAGAGSNSAGGWSDMNRALRQAAGRG